jgi:hypothetical protein
VPAWGGGVEEAVDPVTGTTLATARGGGWLASIGRTVMRERESHRSFSEG